MADVEVLAGERHVDVRGSVRSLNGFRFPGVRRMYVIQHPETSIVRGWNGHQFERKWFYCMAGAFTLALVKLDDMEHPSAALVPEIHHLTAERSELICVPAGYASAMRAETPDAVLMVLSDKTLEESVADSYRYDAHNWVNWEAV